MTDQSITMPGRHRQQVPSGPYDIHVEFDGRLSVCDGALSVLATFEPEYREFAEDMRDRLTVRRLAQVADFMRCSVCGHPANSKRIPLGGGQIIFTHEGGAEHARELM